MRRREMPIREIAVPGPVKFVDREGKPLLRPDGEQAQETFAGFVRSLLDHPLWSAGGYKSVKSQRSVEQALEGARDGKIALAEEDWQRLKTCVEAPKRPDDKPGFTYVTALLPQLVPFMDAIVSAEEAPR
jgi:hypothetical protein